MLRLFDVEVRLEDSTTTIYEIDANDETDAELMVEMDLRRSHIAGEIVKVVAIGSNWKGMRP